MRLCNVTIEPRCLSPSATNPPLAVPQQPPPAQGIVLGKGLEGLQKLDPGGGGGDPLGSLRILKLVKIKINRIKNFNLIINY